LASKFIGTDAQAAAWKLTVATEVVESWVRAQVVDFISVSETLITGRAVVRYDIQNAPVKEFRLRVPAAYTNVEIYGVNIRRRDRTNDEWRVELQNKVRGLFTLTVTWEQPRTGQTNAPIDIAGVQVIGAERETGNVVLLARPPLQLSEKSATEQLQKIDTRELPEWTGLSTGSALPGGEVPVLVYRYVRPGFKLVVEARRYEEAELLQALVDNAKLTTVVADDGQMMTQITLAVPQQRPAKPGNRTAARLEGVVGIRRRAAGASDATRHALAAAHRTLGVRRHTSRD